MILPNRMDRAPASSWRTVNATLLSASLAGALLLASSGAVAQSASVPAREGAEHQVQTAERTDSASPRVTHSAWALGTDLGLAMLLNSRSIALEHLFKPALKVSLTRNVIPRLELGPALALLATSNSNYGVWAAYAQGRYQVYGGAGVQLGLGLGLGAGYNAPILHEDLQADLPVIPYARAELDALWRLTGQSWLGPAISFEQLSVVHLAARLRFGD